MSSMLPYLTFCGQEVANSARVGSYLLAGLSGTDRFHVDLAAMPAILFEDESGNPITYASPAADGAPWYDASMPQSANFLGFLCDRIDGMDTTETRTTTATTTYRGGSVLSPPQLAERQIKLHGWLVASECDALEYGRRWLGEMLGSSSCLDCDLYVRLAEPPADGSDDQRNAWTLYRVALQDLTVTDPYNCCDLREVNVTLVAGDPVLYKPPAICTGPTAIATDTDTPAVTVPANFVADRGSGAVDSTFALAWSVVTTGAIAAGNKVILAIRSASRNTVSAVAGGGLAWSIDQRADNPGSNGGSVTIISADAPAGLASGATINITDLAGGDQFDHRRYDISEFHGLATGPPAANRKVTALATTNNCSTGAISGVASAGDIGFSAVSFPAASVAGDHTPINAATKIATAGAGSGSGSLWTSYKVLAAGSPNGGETTTLSPGNWATAFIAYPVAAPSGPGPCMPFDQWFCGTPTDPPLCCPIDTPVIGSVASVIRIDAYEDFGGARITIDSDCPTASGDPAAAEISTGPLPANTSLVIDSARHRVTYIDADGVGWDGVPYMMLPAGKSIPWLEIDSDGVPSCVCVEPIAPCAGGSNTFVTILTQRWVK